MGPLENVIEIARKMVADCPTFRGMTPADEDAYNRTHWRGIGENPVGIESGYSLEQLRAVRPCATFHHADFELHNEATGCWLAGGVIGMTLLANVPDSGLIGDELVGREATLDFIRKMDALLGEIRQRIDSGGDNPALVGRTIRLVVEPSPGGREEMKKYGPFFGMAVEIEYGV